MINDFAKFYGTHSKLWYVHSGLPYLLMGWTIFLIYGLYKYYTEK